MKTLPSHLPVRAKIQTFCSILLVSTVFSESVLLLKMMMVCRERAIISLLMLLMIAGGVSFVITSRYLKQRLSAEALAYIGLMFTGGGLLCGVLILHPPGHWLSLMPAMMISGWGQGVIACSLRGSKSENRLHQGFIWRCIASLLITVICWQVQSYFGGNHGFACAFALLVDLSLLGLIFVKVTCADHESSGTGD